MRHLPVAHDAPTPPSYELTPTCSLDAIKFHHVIHKSMLLTTRHINL